MVQVEEPPELTGGGDTGDGAVSTGCRAGDGEGVDGEGCNHRMVCGYIVDGILVIDDRCEHIGTVIGKRREMVGGIRSHGTGRRTTGING